MKWSMIIPAIAMFILLPLTIEEASPEAGADDNFDETKYSVMKKTCEWFLRNDICFGHGWNKELFCTPPYRGTKTEYEKQIANIHPDEIISEGDHYTFNAYLNSNLSQYFSSAPSDTVLIVADRGMTKAVITHIGDYSETCFSGLRYRLEKIDKNGITPTDKFLVLTGELANYTAPITFYSEYTTDDPTLIAIQDSIHAEMDKAYNADLIRSLKSRNPEADSAELQLMYNTHWQKIESYYPNSQRIKTFYSGVEQIILPDTLFMFNTCWYRGGESAWTSIYLLIKKDNNWRVETLKEPRLSGRGVIKIICSLDLNGDGEIEYLSLDGGSISLWMLFERDIIHLKGSGYWGC